MDTNTNTNPASAPASGPTPDVLRFDTEIRFRPSIDKKKEIAKIAFPDYTGKESEIVAWARDKNNLDKAAIKVFIEKCREAEEVYNITNEIPNLHTWQPEELLAIIVGKAQALTVDIVKAARRKGEEIFSEYTFDKMDLLEESEDEETTSSGRLDGDEVKVFSQSVEEFVAERRYKETSPATYAAFLVALTGKANDLFNRIVPMMKHFDNLVATYAKWVDDKQPENRQLVEKALKRQKHLMEKAKAKFARITAPKDELIAV